MPVTWVSLIVFASLVPMQTAALVALMINPKTPAGASVVAPDVTAASLLCSKWPSTFIAATAIIVGLGVGCPVGLVVAGVMGVLALVGLLLTVVLGLTTGRLV